jgi:hypothetical protein
MLNIIKFILYLQNVNIIQQKQNVNNDLLNNDLIIKIKNRKIKKIKGGKVKQENTKPSRRDTNWYRPRQVNCRNCCTNCLKNVKIEDGFEELENLTIRRVV